MPAEQLHPDGQRQEAHFGRQPAALGSVPHPLNAQQHPGQPRGRENHAGEQAGAPRQITAHPEGQPADGLRQVVQPGFLQQASHPQRAPREMCGHHQRRAPGQQRQPADGVQCQQNPHRRIQQRALVIGEQRRAHPRQRIPQRQVTLQQRLRSLMPPRKELQRGRAPKQCLTGQIHRREPYEGKQKGENFG